MNTTVVRLDINKKLHETIEAKQGDINSREVIFYLLNNSTPFNLKNRKVRAYAIKEDGKEIFNDLDIISEENGQCKLKLTTQILSTPGLLEIELVIYEGDKKLSTSQFILKVKRSINSNNSTESSNEYKALDNALIKVEEYNKEFGDKSGKLEEKYTERLNKINEEMNSKTSEKSGLSGWLRSLEFDRNKKVCFIGDSTTDGQAGVAQFLYECLNRYHINSGDNLDGVTIIDKGSSGNTCYNFIRDENGTKGIKSCIDEQADLYVFCYGINDVRLGNTTKEQLKEYITTAIERLLKETNAYILLRIPNSLLADDPSNNNWIQPLSKSQEYTDIMWEAYMELKNKWARVDLIDMQSLIFGRTVKNKADNPYMNDNLHPNSDGMYRIARCIADYIGVTPKIRTDLAKIATKENSDKPYIIYPKILETIDYELVCEGYFVGMGSNYLDFSINSDIAKNLIKKGDIIKIGDELAYDYNGSLGATGANTRILGVTFSNYEKNRKGMVRIYRKRGKISKIFSFVSNNISGKIIGVLPMNNGVVNNIKLTCTKPIPNTIKFKIKEEYQNKQTDIAVINFAINNMSGTTVWQSDSNNHNFIENAVYYLECTETSYSGDILLNLILSN